MFKVQAGVWICAVPTCSIEIYKLKITNLKLFTTLIWLILTEAGQGITCYCTLLWTPSIWIHRWLICWEHDHVCKWVNGMHIPLRIVWCGMVLGVAHFTASFIIKPIIQRPILLVVLSIVSEIVFASAIVAFIFFSFMAKLLISVIGNKCALCQMCWWQSNCMYCKIGYNKVN